MKREILDKWIDYFEERNLSDFGCSEELRYKHFGTDDCNNCPMSVVNKEFPTYRCSTIDKNNITISKFIEEFKIQVKSKKYW